MQDLPAINGFYAGLIDHNTISYRYGGLSFHINLLIPVLKFGILQIIINTINTLG